MLVPLWLQLVSYFPYENVNIGVCIVVIGSLYGFLGVNNDLFCLGAGNLEGREISWGTEVLLYLMG